MSFGLVIIPTKPFSGSEDRKLDSDMLDSHDGVRIHYKCVDEETGKEVAWKDILEGYKNDNIFQRVDSGWSAA
ncbi:Ku protein [uncultured Kriegella sp.]|uniref:Ku protein n=1 Tax=uncultured Kriegella sp. TaxID=1798910 RepID=UPI0030DC62D7